MTARACPVCASVDGELLTAMRFVLPDDHLLPNHYDVVNCARCGMAYATPLPAQTVYDAYYRDLSKYADALTGTSGGIREWDERRLARTAGIIAEFVDDTTDHIVDIGCGRGGLLRRLQLLGYEKLTGVDPSHACAAATQAQPGIRGCVGTLEALPADLGRADLVILSHVLEHVREVGLAVDRLAAMLTPTGRVYIEVPNAARYSDHLNAPFLDCNIEHINHFSLTTLERLFVSRGWRVIDSGRHTIPSSPTALYPVIWLVADRAPQDAPRRELLADRALRPALEAYVTRSRDLLRSLHALCEVIRRDEREIIIWGVGQTTAILLAQTALLDTSVLAFTDSNPLYHDRTIRGIPIVAPTTLAGLRPVPIVIGSLLHGKEIASAIAALGLLNPVFHLWRNP